MLVFIGSTTAIQLRDARQQIQEEITAGTKVANQLLPYFLARAQLLSQGQDREDALKNFLKNTRLFSKEMNELGFMSSP